MKMMALTLSILGSLCIIMVVLTATEISPAFISEMAGLGATATTTLFWGVLAALLCLAGISFGVLSNSEV